MSALWQAGLMEYQIEYPPILWAALRLSVWRLAWFNYSAARLLHPEIRTYL